MKTKMLGLRQHSHQFSTTSSRQLWPIFMIFHKIRFRHCTEKKIKNQLNWCVKTNENESIMQISQFGIFSVNFFIHFHISFSTGRNLWKSNLVPTGYLKHRHIGRIVSCVSSPSARKPRAFDTANWDSYVLGDQVVSQHLFSSLSILTFVFFLVTGYGISFGFWRAGDDAREPRGRERRPDGPGEVHLDRREPAAPGHQRGQHQAHSHRVGQPLSVQSGRACKFPLFVLRSEENLFSFVSDFKIISSPLSPLMQKPLCPTGLGPKTPFLAVLMQETDCFAISIWCHCTISLKKNEKKGRKVGFGSKQRKSGVWAEILVF